MGGGLPPGPRLPPVVQAAGFWRRHDAFLRGCQRRYGDVFTLRLALVGTVVYVADPALIREAFQEDPDVFRAGAANAFQAPILGRRSVMLSDGSRHLRKRKLMLPPFHGQAVRRYADEVADVTDAELARWPREGVVALRPRLQRVTLEVILRALLGVEDPGRVDELRRLVPQVIGVRGEAMLLFRWPGLERHGPWRRFVERRDRFDAVMRDELARRRDDPRLEEREDVLSMLVRARYDDGRPLRDADLRDQAVTLMVAGFDTTATAISWCLERLVRHPPALARATRAAREGGDDAYLDAVAKEALRLRPPLPVVGRRLAREAELGEWSLPAGSTVMPGIVRVQRDPRRWEDADAFRPERFLGREQEPYTWLPFGGGTRRCLGAAFAGMEMRVVLTRILRAFDLEPARGGGERAVVRHVTLAPARGARARIRACA